jgi:hypothetical protein
MLKFGKKNLKRVIRRGRKQILKTFFILFLVASWLLTGWPAIWPIGRLGINTMRFPPEVQKAKAVNFSMQTGYYVGDGIDNRQITGLGFQPNLVMIKDDTTVGTAGMIFKTSAMSGELTLVLAETDANLTTDYIQSLDSDGFTIGTNADVNSANVGYFWAAFGGSDCSSSGNFCVGSYTGNGTSQTISSVGFQPDLVVVKRGAASSVGGVWRSSAMSGTVSQYFGANNQLASGGIESLTATGFSVGSNADVNASGNTYYFFAFRETSNTMDVGTYTGNGLDNRVIDSGVDPGLTFEPNFVWIKNSSAATAQAAVASIREHYGDRSVLFTDSSSAADNIQYLRSGGGFEVGTAANVNSSGVVYYYAAFGGAPNHSAGSGNFYMANGSYTGTGTSFSISGLGFRPDLVIIKHNDQATDQYAVFRTSLMVGDRTAYFANAATVFTGGITSLDTNGFTVGTSATVNTSGDTYYWTAFGNAMRPDSSGGSSNFYVGQYIGTSRDNVDIRGLPIQPDLVVVKRVGTTAGAWRTSNQSGDVSLFFHAAAQSADVIQGFHSSGFQVGTNAATNSSGSTYDFFMFTTGSLFVVNTYTGNGSSQNITTVGFQPDLLFIKKTTGGTARGGVLRTSAQAGNAAQPFLNTATITGGVTNLLSNGFSVGSATETNESTFVYQYAAWYGKNYNQSAYRFFENANSADVGNPLAAQDTAATLTSAGQAFRLRVLLHLGNTNLFQSGENFKLQYVGRGSGTCSTPSGGNPSNWTDVTTTTLIAYNDNSGAADGNNLTTNANDPSHGSPAHTTRAQTYEEANNFTNSNLAVSKGEDAMWDFALIDNSSLTSTTFCLRVVKSDGSLLDTYSVIPEVTTASAAQPTFTQNDFEWFVDENSVSLTDAWPTGSLDLSENEVFTQLPAAKRPLVSGDRIRIQINITVGTANLSSGSQAFQLEYVAASDCTTASGWATVGAIGSATIWRFFDNTSLTDGTTQVNQISTSTTGAEGRYLESNSASWTNPNAVNSGQSMEWDFAIENNGASENTTYCFRVAKYGGTALDTYNSDSYPKLTTAPGISNLMRHGNFFQGGSEKGFYWVN